MTVIFILKWIAFAISVDLARLALRGRSPNKSNLWQTRRGRMAARSATKGREFDFVRIAGRRQASIGTWLVFPLIWRFVSVISRPTNLW